MSRLAFALFEFFPHGGLQRDLLATVERCLDRGHEVHVYARAWRGDVPSGATLHLLPSRAWTNVGRDAAFVRAFHRALAGETFDAVVGFNRMPGLDVYFAADPPHRERAETRGPLYRLTRRHRRRDAWEADVFGDAGASRLLVLTAREREAYRRWHGTAEERFRVLPPNFDPRSSGEDDGRSLRLELGVSESARMLLSVGSGFRVKGVERTLRALAALSAGLRAGCRLIVVGDDDPTPYRRLARRLNVADAVTFLPGRDDIARFYRAADLLVHASHRETAGKVILEAIAAGLPVVTGDRCGYAEHVRAADAGVVLEEPYTPADLSAALEGALTDDARRAAWGAAGRAYGERAELRSCHDEIVRIIEEVAMENARLRSSSANGPRP